MRGLVAFNFYGGALALTAASAIFAFDAVNGRELSSASMLAYAVGIALLLASGGLWAYRKYCMQRYYSDLQPALTSNNLVRRRKRNRPLKKEAFLEPLGVNQGIKVNRPELVSQVETCRHPDYIQASTKGWNCVRCSLTVIADRKPEPGSREIV